MAPRQPGPAGPSQQANVRPAGPVFTRAMMGMQKLYAEATVSSPRLLLFWLFPSHSESRAAKPPSRQFG